MVEHARRIRKRDPDAFDEVWCVVDVDDFTDVPEAVNVARRHGIGLVVSNPCFELWLLLHLESCTRHLTTAQTLDAVKQRLPHYDKAALRFSDFSVGLDDARARAIQLDPSGAEVQRNPRTNAWRLVDRIR